MAKKDNNNGAKQSGGWQKVTPPPASPEENGAALSQTGTKSAPNQKQSETPSKEEESKKSTTPPTKSAGGKQKQNVNGNSNSKKKKSPPAQKTAQSKSEIADVPATESSASAAAKDKNSEEKIEKVNPVIPSGQVVEEQTPKISKAEEERIAQKYGLQKPDKPLNKTSGVIAKAVIIDLDKSRQNAEEKTVPQPSPKPKPEPESKPESKPKAKVSEQVSDKKKVPAQKTQTKRTSQKAEKKRKYHDDWEDDMRLNGGSRKYTAAVPIGGVFVLLALIGLITVIMFSVQATERLIDNSKEKEMFGNLILPVLMFDPVPFEDPSEITEIPLLRSSIWSAITQNMDKYTFVEGTAITVPKSDVDVACARLFGPGVTLKHQSFEDDISLYSYSTDIQSYYIPADANILYTPKVEEISKKGDIFSLTVGYIAPNTQWMETLRGEKSEPIPSKYMIYEMKKVDDHYQLVSIKDPPEGAVPGVPQIQPQDAITVPGGDQNNGGVVEIQPLEPATVGETSPDGSAEGDGTANPEEGSTSEAV